MWELSCPQEKPEFKFFFKPWTYWVIHYYLTFLTQVKEYFYLFISGSTEAWSYNVISHLQTNLIEDKARQTVEQSSPRIMNCHEGEMQITKATAFQSIQINVKI